MVLSPANPSEDVLREQALAVGRTQLFEEAHAVQVARLALVLFDRLREMSGIDPSARRLLLAAALLHDIGMRISFQKHHKHSHRLILAASLPALTARELAVVAAVARYHRKADPAEKHAEYAALPTTDKDLVCRLASLLRLADVLDRDHAQRVRDLSVAVAADEVVIRTPEIVPADPSVLERKGALFAKVFGRRVRFEP